MAVREQREVYSHVTIDCSDMTLTEYDVNGARTYDIKEILERGPAYQTLKLKSGRARFCQQKRGEDIRESKV